MNQNTICGFSILLGSILASQLAHEILGLASGSAYEGLSHSGICPSPPYSLLFGFRFPPLKLHLHVYIPAGILNLNIWFKKLGPMYIVPSLTPNQCSSNDFGMVYMRNGVCVPIIGSYEIDKINILL